MTSRIRSSAPITAVLAATLVLAGCGNGNKGAGESASVGGPAQTASSASQPESTVKFRAYTPEAKVGAIASCNIETFDGSAFQAESREAAPALPHTVAGWIAAPHATNPIYKLRLDDKVQGKYFEAQLKPNVERPDVVAADSSKSTPLVSGFKLELAADAVPAGQYHLYLATMVGGRTSLCDNGRQVEFK